MNWILGLESEIGFDTTEFFKLIHQSLEGKDHLFYNLRESWSNKDIQDIFKIFHTIKGLSNFWGLKALFLVSTEAENMLNQLFNSDTKPTEATIEILLEIKNFYLSSTSMIERDVESEALIKNSELLIRNIKKTTNVIMNNKSNKTEYAALNTIEC
jgi:chemotaxis protein histidine kinase CheA